VQQQLEEDSKLSDNPDICTDKWPDDHQTANYRHLDIDWKMPTDIFDRLIQLAK